jgi:hypothetical protein
LNEQEVWDEFINAIIMQAVKDWRKLCKKDRRSYSFSEIRRFFQGEWGAALCGGIDPLIILNQLEHERELSVNEKEGGLLNVKMG